MSIKNLINKSDCLKLGIESIEALIVDHGFEPLKPTLNFLKEEKQKMATTIANHTLNIDVQHEEINRLSHI